MPLPTVSGTLGVPPPAFVRKLRRKVHWGGPGDPIDERAAAAVREVFLTESGTTFSVYLIKNDEELRRLAIGLNGNRDSLTEVLDLIAFLPGELQSSGIFARASPGATRCRYANGLHHDISGLVIMALRVRDPERRQPAFGGPERKTLYVTASKTLYRIRIGYRRRWRGMRCTRRDADCRSQDALLPL